MRLTKTFAVCLLVGCLLAAAPRPAAARGEITLWGHVSMDAQSQYLPRFAVRLYFPKAANRPPIATVTNGKGWFEFTNLDAGRYLLEVYQGEEMVYQEVVVVERGPRQEHNVQLRAKKGSD